MKVVHCCSKALLQNNNKYSKCIRNDNKIFTLPRKFTQKQCRHPSGFSMKASCAPYKYCQTGGKKSNTKRKKYTRKSSRRTTTVQHKNKKTHKSSKNKKKFLFNPDNTSKSFDVYIDKDPSDTIPIQYTTIDDVKNTIRKLERLYKQHKYTHKRIWQVGMILMVRLRVLRDKKPQHYKIAKEYFDFLKKRTNTSKDKRKRLTFRI